MREDAVEVELVGAHEPVGERVEAQVCVGGRCGRRIQIDLDGDRLDDDGATRILTGELVEPRGGALLRSRPRVGWGVPGVEDGAVGGRRCEAFAPDPSLCAPSFRLANAVACAGGDPRGGDAATPRSIDWGCRVWTSLSRRSSSPAHLRHPERVRRRDHLADAIYDAVDAHAHLSLYRDGDTIVARTDLGRERRVVIAGHIDTVPINHNLPTRIVDDGGSQRSGGRGTVDMKAGVAVQLKLAAELVAPRYDVTWMWYDHEEVAPSATA